MLVIWSWHQILIVHIENYTGSHFPFFHSRRFTIFFHPTRALIFKIDFSFKNFTEVTNDFRKSLAILHTTTPLKASGALMSYNCLYILMIEGMRLQHSGWFKRQSVSTKKEKKKEAMKNIVDCMYFIQINVGWPQRRSRPAVVLTYYSIFTPSQIITRVKHFTPFAKCHVYPSENTKYCQCWILMMNDSGNCQK